MADQEYIDAVLDYISSPLPPPHSLAQFVAQGLLNLLSNEIKNTEEDSATLAYDVAKGFLKSERPYEDGVLLKAQPIFQRAIEKMRAQAMNATTLELSEEYKVGDEEDLDEWGEEDDEEEDEDVTEFEGARPVVSLRKQSSSADYAPRSQEQERYQPAQGQSRLGRDRQTGKYVDVPQASRRQGLYIIGATGTGKSGLIENLIIQDIKQGLGVGLLDPHGDLTNNVLARLPADRVVDGVRRATEEDVILLDISNTNFPFGLNLFSCPDPSDLEALTIASNHVRDIFWKLWGTTGIIPSWGVLLEKVLENATLTLLENPGYTMAEIPLLLYNDTFRKHLVNNLSNDQVQDFWEQEYNILSDKDQREEIASTLTRVNSFIRQPLVRNIVGQSQTSVDFRKVMDDRKILLVRLNVRLGEGITTLLGTMIIAELLNAAYSRADLPVNKRKQFNLYADEFQRFATEDFAILLTEARKFGLGTTIAHQFRDQLDHKNRGATLTAANLVVFRVQPEDATELAGRFNITPQEAWEEELEEEWVEVRKPQRHERKEEQVEVEVEEEVKEISQTPVDHLVRGTHGSPRVRELTQKILVPLVQAVGKEKQYPAVRLYWFQFVPDNAPLHNLIHPNWGKDFDAIESKEYINALLVDLMDGRVSLGTKTFADRIEKIVVSLAPFIGWLGDTAYSLMRSHYARYGGKLPERSRESELYDSLSALIWGLVAGQSQLNRLEQNLSSSIAAVFAKWEAVSENSSHQRRTRTHLSYAEEEKIRKEAEEALQGWAKAAVNGLVTYVRYFVTLCEELAKEENHILVPTGQKRMVKRKQPHITWLTHESEKITHPRKTILHPQRSYADMLNEVASQLANLPLYTARVKITADRQGVEHTAKTLEPEKGLGRTALQERIDRITEYNRQAGYIQTRQVVEAEIRTRQNQWKEPPEPPPIPRRSPSH
jgi:hypothetical protein